MRKNILIISAVFAALLFACGCKGKDDLKTTVTSVKTDPAQMTLKVGDSKQISVSWTPAEVKATPSFSSNKESVATVNDKGLVTAVAEGAASIIVKVGEQTAICKVTVSNSGITEVSVQPESVVLMVGNTESLKVTWTPAEIEATPTYSIDNKEVATVSDKGVVTAVAEGKATITITVLDKKLTCPVDVIASVKNEFPLLKYNVLNDEEDPEVSSYEKQMGRKYGKIFYGGHEFYGYQNKELDLIPGALYGLNNKKTGEQVIIALSKENITNFPKTRILLKEYGFSNIEMDIDDSGNQMFYGKHDTDPNLSVKGWNSPVSKLGSTLSVWFVRKAEPIKAKAKDFPSWEAFQTRNVAEMKQFEEKLGIRVYDPKLSDENKKNLIFQTKSAKLFDTNFSMVLYFNEPQQGPRFINSILGTVQQPSDLKTEAFKEWLTTNGFGFDYSFDATEGSCQAFNADKSLQIYSVYFKAAGGMVLQIFPPKNKAQVLKKMAEPETAELIRRSVRTQNSFIPDFR